LSFWYDAPRSHDIVTGGTTHGWFTVHRPTVPPDGVPGFHQPDARRVSAAGPALRDRVPRPDGSLADGWETADRAPVYRLQKRVCPTFYTRDSSIIWGPFSIKSAMSRERYLIAW